MKYLAYIVCLTVVAGGAYFFLGAHTSKGDASGADLWQVRIKNEGGAAAYADFKREYASREFEEQHDTAHVIGGKLYEVEGIDALAVCDQSFAFGCYHGFFGRAVADKGAPIVPVLAQACKEKFGDNSTGCEHGIGHGIMEHLGPDGLLQGLELCTQTKQKDKLFGCTSGLFMEYNTPIDFVGGAHVTVRPLDPSNMQAPCNTIVPQEFRASCYFEIPLWWKDVLGDEYENIGNTCARAGTQGEREACWKGWGTVVAENVEYDAARAGSLCALIDDAKGAGFCKLGVAMRFFGTQSEKRVGHLMCEQMSGALREECLALAPRE